MRMTMSIAVEPGRLHFAKREKYWEGLFDYADENFHDTVGTQSAMRYYSN